MPVQTCFAQEPVQADEVLSDQSEQHGIGTASCGPGVLPDYQLRELPEPFGFTFCARRAG
jgi:hypothetical protein